MEPLKIRKAAVAGQFYPSSAQRLKKEIEALVDKTATTTRTRAGAGATGTEKFNALACILPHAGYMYSGGVAGCTISQINIKDKVILLGPNHTGYGVPFSIMSEGFWQTPLGEVEIDSNLTNRLLEHSRYLKQDTLAHQYEHSLEVEIPFLQYAKSDFKIVPITVLSDNINELKEIGSEIAAVIQNLNIKDSTLIVASSDMTHYEPQETAQKKDAEAIEAILKLDEDRLMASIRRYNITMCGYAPVVIMLSAVKLLGAKTARLIKYQTSGDVTGDFDSVVGYAGIIIY